MFNPVTLPLRSYWEYADIAAKEKGYPLMQYTVNPQAPITGKPCGAWGAQGGSSTFYVLRRMKDYG